MDDQNTVKRRRSKSQLVKGVEEPYYFWSGKDLKEQLYNKLKEKNISKTQYNQLIGAECDLDKVDVSRISLFRPFTAQAHLLPNILDCDSMVEVFKEFDIPCVLPEYHQKALDAFVALESVNQDALERIKIIADTINGGWHLKHIPNPARRIAACKTRLNFDKDEQLKKDVPSVKISDCKDEDLYKYYIVNCKLSAIVQCHPMIPLTSLYKLCEALDVSPRWISDYNREGCWFGYSPLVENTYDSWSVQSKETKEFLMNIARVYF